MKIEQATSANVRDLWSEVEATVAKADALEGAAQQLATALHGHFEESVVLARVYLRQTRSSFAASPKEPGRMAS